ncbi:kinase, partial [Thraustotheca clavata]
MLHSGRCVLVASVLATIAANQCCFKDGDIVSLKSDIGLYLGRCNQCIKSEAFADSAFVNVKDPSMAPRAKWKVVNTGTGSIALQADSGNYLARCTNCAPGATYPDEAFVQILDWKTAPWAQWKCHDAGDGKIALEADTGNFLARCSGCVNEYSNTGMLNAKSWEDPSARWQIEQNGLFSEDRCVSVGPTLGNTTTIPSTIATGNTTTIPNNIAIATSIPQSDPTQSTSSSTGIVVGIVVGAAILIVIVALIFIRRRKQQAKAHFTNNTTGVQNNDTTADSTNQILPHYQNPYLPVGNTNTNDEPKYDKVVDDDKILDMRPLRKYRLDTSDLVILNSSPIASGAFGEVWLGKLGSTTVAIKRLKKQSSNFKIQKFIEEVILMAKIDSPYIVRFIGASWLTPEDLSCVVEYMDYGDLRSFLAHTTPKQFTWQQKRLSILAVVKGLLYLHSCAPRIIHRDLKSRNVLLDSNKGTKLTDFGESREMNESTMTNDVGTFAWMAPEVMLANKYNASADIYSFGVLLSEYATHQIPYSDMRDPVTKQPCNQFQLINQITSGKLKPTIDGPNTPKWIIELA